MQRWLWMMALLLSALCGRVPAAQAAEPLSVFVSIPPQAYLVERVGGNHVRVHVLVRAGQDPHTFEPTPRQMTALAGARLCLKIGMPFEAQLLEKIEGAYAGLTVVDMTAGVEKRMMEAHGHGDEDEHDGNDEEGEHEKEHEHGREQEQEQEHDDEHEHADADPHVWLSPPLLKTMARNTARALAEADPANAADYEENLEALTEDIEATHARVREVLAPYQGRAFYTFHPAFGYFGDAYGLVQVPVEAEGKRPTPRQLAELIRRARREQVRIVFVQPQFDHKSAGAVASGIGGAVVPMDPLARDVLANLEEMAAKIEAALE
jgi:zinc transport system substrate-binding protein